MIALTIAEQRLAAYLAQARYARNRKRGVADRLICDEDAIRNETASVGAELAFCRLHNVYPALDIDGPYPWDAVLANGETVDVKWTFRRDGMLIVVQHQREILPSRYALMVGAFPNYEYAGWMPAQDLMQPGRINTRLRAPGYCARQHELQKVKGDIE